ncbi:Phytanoyl-CoA dioxygenase [Moelleriella libera RCEF 2490]|uniref:Phytanoyl-CoA dioxygenase n=1 Tax=Moelleriella libera RCEF 2490 TaxID=1081109 RepID=A0A162IPX3_9HYPO|nr:Phytanoyl-CoA dioxygenase [Moelleriella libera RCEF 2490]
MAIGTSTTTSTTTTTTIGGVCLRVNDGPLLPSDVALLRPSSPSEPLAELRDRYASDGYLFLKGLLPRKDVLSAREAYFSRLAPSGVLEPGTPLVHGIFASAAHGSDYPSIGAGSVKNARPGSSEKAAMFTELALKAHTDPWYSGSGGSEEGKGAAEAAAAAAAAVATKEESSSPSAGIIQKQPHQRGFTQHPALKDFIARFTGWQDDTLAIKRTLLRNNTPGNNAIGVHYDQTFLRHGEPTSVTAWVPMGDIRLEGGGLIYLQNGEALGQEIEDEFTKKAKEAGMTDEEMRDAFNRNMMTSGFLSDGPRHFGRQYGRVWLVAEYEAGDVVLHKPHMIHASTINDDPENRIRLGTDLRFVDASRPWDTRWSTHYKFDDGL